MKFDHCGNHMYFRDDNARSLFWSAHQRAYFGNSHDDTQNFGKVGHLATSESMSMNGLDSGHSRNTGMKAVTNYYVTDGP